MTETPRRRGAKAAQHAFGSQVGCAILGVAAVPPLADGAAGEFGLARAAAVLARAALGFVAVHQSMVARLDRSRARAEHR